jgi:hypothetical protein
LNKNKLHKFAWGFASTATGCPLLSARLLRSESVHCFIGVACESGCGFMNAPHTGCILHAHQYGLVQDPQALLHARHPQTFEHPCFLAGIKMLDVNFRSSEPIRATCFQRLAADVASPRAIHESLRRSPLRPVSWYRSRRALIWFGTPWAIGQQEGQHFDTGYAGKYHAINTEMSSYPGKTKTCWDPLRRGKACAAHQFPHFSEEQRPQPAITTEKSEEAAVIPATANRVSAHVVRPRASRWMEKGAVKRIIRYSNSPITPRAQQPHVLILQGRGGALGSPYAQTSLPPLTAWLRNRGCQTAMTALVAGTRLRGRPHAVSTEALAEVGARAPVVERRMFVLGSAVFFLSRAAEYISSAWKRLRRPTLVSSSVHSNELSFKAG